MEDPPRRQPLKTEREADGQAVRGGHNDAFLTSEATYRRALAGFLRKVEAAGSAPDSSAE